MRIFSRWTTGWTSRVVLAIEAEETKKDLGRADGEEKADRGVKNPIGDAAVIFFWIGRVHAGVSREGTF